MTDLLADKDRQNAIQEIVEFVGTLAADELSVDGSSPRFVLARVQPVDENLDFVGAPFNAVARHISQRDLKLVHCQPVQHELLTVELPTASGDYLHLLVRVSACQPQGPFHEIYGDLVRKLDRPKEDRGETKEGVTASLLTDQVAKHDVQINELKTRLEKTLEVVQLINRKMQEVSRLTGRLDELEQQHHEHETGPS